MPLNLKKIALGDLADYRLNMPYFEKQSSPSAERRKAAGQIPAFNNFYGAVLGLAKASPVLRLGGTSNFECRLTRWTGRNTFNA